jgi:hypothetical protein
MRAIDPTHKSPQRFSAASGCTISAKVRVHLPLPPGQALYPAPPCLLQRPVCGHTSPIPVKSVQVANGSSLWKEHYL